MIRIAFFFGDLGGLSCSTEPVSIGSSLGTDCFFRGGQCHHHNGGDSHRVAAIQRSGKDVGPRDDGAGPIQLKANPVLKWRSGTVVNYAKTES
jgi:hypothetical protein